MHKFLKGLLFLILGTLPLSASMYLEKPWDFGPRVVEAAGIYVEHEGKYLMLHRQDYKPQGNRWGIPAGKVDKGETALQAAIRETYEETGIKISSKSPEYLGTVYFKDSKNNCIFHMFKAKVSDQPKVKIRLTEHKGYTWVTPDEAFDLRLMDDQKDSLELVYSDITN